MPRRVGNCDRHAYRHEPEGDETAPEDQVGCCEKGMHWL